LYGEQGDDITGSTLKEKEGRETTTFPTTELP